MTHRFLGLLSLLVAGLAGASELNWPDFMARHRMTWDSMPKSWTQAPHFGNGLIGTTMTTSIHGTPSTSPGTA